VRTKIRFCRSQILHALVRGIRMTQEGTPVLLEFSTAREKTFSTG
jgi:hypothetical protein